ncbi:hypothetical protein [Actomonas aquatica]|uniref:Uncharacterized protein n=1 Tax=Actomonas aquatica TaxID=2866162 RepID=A0ABZ1C5D8_9BACT|nr:hypothetical protein [Opitutus sp. WL0086]WRQ86701.1 hypothetical protein K1X11_017955 [Opitutus sp. WL0086]
MSPLKPPPRCAALIVAAGLLGSASALAQTQLPALRTGADSANRNVNGPIPDVSIFDGSAYPPEERPEQGLIAPFEMPGQQQPSTQNVPGPGEQQGGGGQGMGGDSPMDGMGGPQVSMSGPQMPGIPGMPSMGGGGAGGIPGLPQLPQMGGGSGSGSLPSLPTLDMGDRGKEGQQGQGGGGPQGEQSGEQGQQGPGGMAGTPSDQQAPTLAGRQGRQLQKPGAVQIGDEGAKLATADIPVVDANRAVDGTQQGEDRMAVKSAGGGNQTANRSSGTERGVDIPSNL